MSFGGLVLTNNGRNKMAAAISEENALKFTHIQLGDKTFNGSYSSKAELSHMVMEIPVTRVQRNDNEVLIECDWNSIQAPTAFYLREIGIIGNGVLCYYDNARSGDAEYIDPESETVSKQKRFRFTISVTDDTEITTVINSGLYALTEELEAVAFSGSYNDLSDKPTADDIEAISVKQLSNENLDDIKNAGFYYAAGGNTVTGKPTGVNHFGLNVTRSAAGVCTQILYDPANHNEYIRSNDAGTWYVWIQSVKGVKGNAESTYRTGNVNITPENIGLGNVGNYKAVSTVASQGLSDAEKANARANAGAAPVSHASAATTYGVSTAANYGHAMASSTTPKANGTAAVGSETTKFARGDHVHPLQTSVSGSSGSCTGNAATATKLATARTLRTNLASTSTASFDGSANITPGVTGTLPVANGGTGKTTLTSGQVLVGNGTGAISQRAIDTTAGGTSDSTALITSGAVYDAMVFKSISITGTGNLSISSILSGDYSDLSITLYADVSGARNVYTWFLPTANVSSSGQLHLISGYKTGSFEGIGEVLITNATSAKIVNCIFGGTQYSSTARLVIKYR